MQFKRKGDNLSPSEEVFHLLEKGKISPVTAFTLLQEEQEPKIKSSKKGKEINNVEDILKELDSLVGLNTVKKLVRELQAFVEIQKRREDAKLATEPLVLHMIFKGNPGTGKTTVARIIGKLMKEIGVLQKGHILELERADLVGEYIGHTAQKTKDQLKKALGGVMFVDEAYSLARGGEKDFGKEAIDTMVKYMEDHKNNLILILAGYEEEMTNFLKINPGLKSRFPIHIDFPDYNISELLSIGDQMLKEREYELDSEARDELTKILIRKLTGQSRYEGNARLVRNLIEKAIRKQALRLINVNNTKREDLILITKADILHSLDEVRSV